MMEENSSFPRDNGWILTGCHGEGQPDMLLEAIIGIIRVFAAKWDGNNIYRDC